MVPKQILKPLNGDASLKIKLMLVINQTRVMCRMHHVDTKFF